MSISMMITRHLLISIACFALMALLGTAEAGAQAVVTDGRITNVYVWPIDVDGRSARGTGR